MGANEARALRYAEHRPALAVRDVALAYWSFDVRTLPTPSFVHRVWPDGCCSLVLARCGGRSVVERVQGTFLSPIDIPVQEGMEYRGIRFRPEMGARWFGRSAEAMLGLNLDATEVFGDAIRPLAEAIGSAANDAQCAAIFDAWIASRRAHCIELGTSDSLVRRAVDLLIDCDGQCRMAHLAAALSVQPRTLQRRFVSAVGLSPKEFAQIRRLRAVLRRTVEEDLPARIGWSGTAFEGGFADQSHLIREVGRRTHFSPIRLQERLQEIEHERLLD